MSAMSIASARKRSGRDGGQLRSRGTPATLEVTYLDGRGILREALGSCTKAGFAVADLATRHVGGDHHAVAVRLELRGNGSLSDLAMELDSIDGVLAVSVASEEAANSD